MVAVRTASQPAPESGRRILNSPVPRRGSEPALSGAPQGGGPGEGAVRAPERAQERAMARRAPGGEASGAQAATRAWAATAATGNPKRRLEEARRRFGRDPRWREEGNAAAGIFGCRGREPRVSAPVARSAAEAAGPLHLAKEEKLVDLLERPVGVADRDARQVGRQVGRLVRRHALEQERPVGRPRGQDPAGSPGWARGQGVGGRPRRDRGGRREHRPGRVAARRSSLTPSTSTTLACHGAPCRPVFRLSPGGRLPGLMACDCVCCGRMFGLTPASER